jgi:hypothetical protein
VERIARASKLDVGGIEYLVDDRDGKHYYYDVNALSNFVADAPNVVGFDPWPRFVDYLEERAAAGGGEPGSGSRLESLIGSSLPAFGGDQSGSGSRRTSRTAVGR